MKEFVISLLGSENVGKSSIAIQLKSGTFATIYNPTVEETYRTELEIYEGEVVKLEILDVAGLIEVNESLADHIDHLKQIQNNAIRRAQGFILVYSVSSLKSFQALQPLWDNLIVFKKNQAQEEFKDVLNIPLVLMGNKCDVVKRQVSTEHGEALAAKFDCHFFESSAKANVNIREAFEALVIDLINLDRKEEKVVNSLSKQSNKKCIVM